MRKRAPLLAGIIISLILMSSCMTSNQSKIHSLQDPKDDPELVVGDLGVEEQWQSPNRLRGFSSIPGGQLLDPNGYPLIRQAPNPSIKPLEGSYVENLIQAAKSYLGTPYIFGSDRTEPSSFDCSDFTRWVFLSLGMDLPWDSRAQAAYVHAFSDKTYTSLKEAKRGDLLFFSGYRGNHASDYKGLTPEERPVSHLGIYLGNGEIIHCASQKSGGVNIHKLTWRQLDSRFLFGGGIIP